MSDKKIYTYYNEALSLICGDICNPRMVIIYPVYGCNLSCPNCLCNNFNTDKVYMDFDKFKKLSLQIKAHGIRSIELCGGGEPLIHPDIQRIISWVTNKLHMSLGIMSNGVALNDELNYMIATRATYIRVSLYNNTFDLVTKKLKKLVDVKKQTGSSVKIGAKLLASKSNKDMLETWCNRLSEIGLDLISIKAERNSTDEISDEEAVELEEKLNALNPIISATLKKTYITERCWLSPIHTLIDPYGDMYICCYYMGREDDHKIGNVFRKDFGEIWGSEQHRRALAKIDADKCNIYDCRWHLYNKEMKQLFESNAVQHQFC